jgi:hypothetical protein
MSMPPISSAVCSVALSKSFQIRAKPAGSLPTDARLLQHFWPLSTAVGFPSFHLRIFTIRLLGRVFENWRHWPLEKQPTSQPAKPTTKPTSQAKPSQAKPSNIQTNNLIEPSQQPNQTTSEQTKINYMIRQPTGIKNYSI